MAFIPSPQQAAFLSWIENGHGSAILIAVAGAGKTTTLVQATKKMTGTVFLGAYNKKIADEIGHKLQQEGVDINRVRSATFHSAGFSALRRVAPRIQVDKNGEKVPNLIVRQMAHKFGEDRATFGAIRSFVSRWVSLAKNHGMGFLHPMHDAEAWLHLVEHYGLDEDLPEGFSADDMVADAIKVLELSNEQWDTLIDFDDMVYLPLVKNVRMFANDWVLIDEAQDTNPTRRALAKKMLKPTGRMVAVGDPCQAIYGFTGADNDAMDIIRREFNAIDLPLTVTFRCPKEVVALARTWVSHIEAAPSAPEGKVSEIAYEEIMKTPTFRSTDVILCRNTKPLVQTAYALIRKGIGCTIEGRDIGNGLVVLIKKMRARGLDALARKINAHMEIEGQRLLAKGKESQAASLQDKCDTILLLIDRVTETGNATLEGLLSLISSMFSDSHPGTGQRILTLSTVHKAKGREWDRVFLLGRTAYMPSPYARQQWQQEQERNLIYVAVTRSKGELIEVKVTKKSEGKALAA